MQHQQEMSAKLAAEEAHARRLRRVTARPLPVTVDVPVVPPKPDTKPLTLPDPFELKSLVSGEGWQGAEGAEGLAGLTWPWCYLKQQVLLLAHDDAGGEASRSAAVKPLVPP